MSANAILQCFSRKFSIYHIYFYLGAFFVLLLWMWFFPSSFDFWNRAAINFLCLIMIVVTYWTLPLIKMCHSHRHVFIMSIDNRNHLHDGNKLAVLFSTVSLVFAVVPWSNFSLLLKHSTVFYYWIVSLLLVLLAFKHFVILVYLKIRFQ